MSPPKTLILLRHGKSAYPEGVADHERPLAERGWREAALAGRWLLGLDHPVQRVLCSTARRTRETLEAANVQAPAQLLRALYGASAVEVVGLAASLPEEIDSALVVGHFPGMPETAETLHELTGEPPSPALARLLTKYPTSALTRIEVTSTWAELPVTGGSVVEFYVPRETR